MTPRNQLRKQDVDGQRKGSAITRAVALSGARGWDNRSRSHVDEALARASRRASHSLAGPSSRVRFLRTMPRKSTGRRPKEEARGEHDARTEGESPILGLILEEMADSPRRSGHSLRRKAWRPSTSSPTTDAPAGGGGWTLAAAAHLMTLSKGAVGPADALRVAVAAVLGAGGRGSTDERSALNELEKRWDGLLRLLQEGLPKEMNESRARQTVAR